jgi:hypothetical protein
MQISSNYSTPNFQARIKLKAPNMQQLLTATVGTALLGTASASAADVGVSIASNSEQMQDSFLNSGLPKGVLESHEDLLTSASGRYDAAGYRENIPVQSTIFPSSMAGSAASSAYIGSNSLHFASEDNFNKTAVSSKEFSANPKTKDASAVSGLLSTAAGSLYSGFPDADIVNLSLPEVSVMDEDVQAVCASSGISSATSASTLIGLETSARLSKADANGEKSAKNSNDDKKLPS